MPSALTSFETLEVTTANTKQSSTLTGDFGGAIFSIVQSKTRSQHGLTTLRLLEGAVKGGPSFTRCTAKTKKGAHLAAASSRVLQLPALERTREIPHARVLLSRDRPRHEVGHDRPVPRHADGGASRHGGGERLPATQERDCPRRAPLPGQGAVISDQRLDGPDARVETVLTHVALSTGPILTSRAPGRIEPTPGLQEEPDRRGGLTVT